MNYKNLTDIENKRFILNALSDHKNSGKLAGFKSLSTSSICNPFCNKMCENPENVCAYCYARRALNTYRKNMIPKLTRNYEFFTTVELTEKDIPFIPTEQLRFESFGEIANGIQYRNYNMIAEKNKHCYSVLWTKNNAIVQRNLSSKSSNLHLIRSSRKLNFADELIYPYEKVFTVYDCEKSIGRQNCFGHCETCNQNNPICYTQNNIAFVNEKQK